MRKVCQKLLQPVPKYGPTLMNMEISDLAQVPEACTLPTVEQPLRVAEFDRLFAVATATERLGPMQARIVLPSSPQIAAQTADLVVRETQCCSFFTFSLTASAGQ